MTKVKHPLKLFNDAIHELLGAQGTTKLKWVQDSYDMPRIECEATVVSCIMLIKKGIGPGYSDFTDEQALKQFIIDYNPTVAANDE